MEAESIITYAGVIISTLVATIAFLWKIVDFHHKKDIANLEATNKKLDTLQGDFISTLKEVSEIKGKLAGQHMLADEVLRKVRESNNDT